MHVSLPPSSLHLSLPPHLLLFHIESDGDSDFEGSPGFAAVIVVAVIVGVVILGCSLCVVCVLYRPKINCDNLCECDNFDPDLVDGCCDLALCWCN